MEKLIIMGRTNWESGFYIKFKSEKASMKIIKKIIKDLGSDYFVDNHVIPKTLSNYEKWKDQWIPVCIKKNLDIDIVCGNRIIHMIVHNCSDFEIINETIDKYCDWIEP